MCVLSVNFHFTGNKVAGVICSNHMLSVKIHIFKTSYSKNYTRTHLGDALTYKTFHSLDVNSQVFLRMLITSMMVVTAESHRPAPGSAIPREALVVHEEDAISQAPHPRLLRGEGQLSAQKRECVCTFFEAVTHSRGSLWLLLQLLPLQTSFEP